MRSSLGVYQLHSLLEGLWCCTQKLVHEDSKLEFNTLQTLSQEDAHSRNKWRRKIWRATGQPRFTGKWLKKRCIADVPQSNTCNTNVMKKLIDLSRRLCSFAAYLNSSAYLAAEKASETFENEAGDGQISTRHN